MCMCVNKDASHKPKCWCLGPEFVAVVVVVKAASTVVVVSVGGVIRPSIVANSWLSWMSRNRR